MTKDYIAKAQEEAEVEWGLKIGPKSTQRDQNRVLKAILTDTLTTYQERVDEVIDAEMVKHYTDEPEEYGKGRYDALFDLKATISKII